MVSRSNWCTWHATNSRKWTMPLQTGGLNFMQQSQVSCSMVRLTAFYISPSLSNSQGFGADAFNLTTVLNLHPAFKWLSP
jgi:hypothetical protein